MCKRPRAGLKAAPAGGQRIRTATERRLGNEARSGCRPRSPTAKARARRWRDDNADTVARQHCPELGEVANSAGSSATCWWRSCARSECRINAGRCGDQDVRKSMPRSLRPPVLRSRVRHSHRAWAAARHQAGPGSRPRSLQAEAAARPPLRRTPARVSRWKPAASQAIDRIHAMVNGIVRVTTVDCPNRQGDGAPTRCDR
jgi:hypothetical protein